MKKNLTRISAIAGACAAFFALTAFTPYQDKLPQRDARAYKTHALGIALLCGSNDPKNQCYGRQMAKWLAERGYKQQSLAMMAELPKKDLGGN